MKISDHVTRTQIAAFGAGSLATTDSRTVGGHLIRCVECRSLLPIPDPARVWTAITREHDFDEAPQTRSFPELEQSFYQTVVGIFSRRNRLAWLVEVGDFAMNHMDLLTGGVDIAATRGVTSPDYRVVSLRVYSTCHDRFFLYLFQMCYRNRIFYGFGQGSSQLGRWRLPTEQFRDFVFPVPPYREQVQIAEFIEEETDKLDSLTAEAMRAIELLQERRTALISAAVTGKIDVRQLGTA